ncbi:hypothetical protein AB0B25_24640 [Nocardia sp. NPDC049190]|uniref:hypothetical protein n=1 Tax=Nocardia sp. NPDC049190 TaxID=3155650 RepID=UPI0033FEA9CA
MHEGADFFPRYITRETELPLCHPAGESEALKSAIAMGELAIDRLADLLRTGTPTNPAQTVPELRREFRLERWGEISTNSRMYDRYAGLVQKIAAARASIIDSSTAVNGKKGELAAFLTEALGRIEDSVESLNERLKSATPGPRGRIPFRTESALIDAVFDTIETVAREVRSAGEKIRDVVDDIDWRGARIDPDEN